MFKGYKQLSDKEKLILVQIPQGKLVGSPPTRERVFVRLSEIQKESGLSSESFSRAVNKLIKKGLVEKEIVPHLVSFRDSLIEVNSTSLTRAGRAVKRVRSRKIR
jgi:DNA-binding MarR family transcriptional regulator